MTRSSALALPQITEKAFREQVLSVARTCGYACWYDVATNAPRRCVCGRFTHGPRNPAGWPDLVMIRPGADRRSGRVIFAELKREDGDLSPEQKVWLYALKLAGAEVFVWRPSDLQAIGEILMADARP